MKYAIFDLDGTLLDYEGASFEAMDTVLFKHGRKFTSSLHSSIIGTKDLDWSRKLIDLLQIGDQITPPEFITQYHEEIERLIPSMQLMPGAANLLQQLHKSGIPIAIATSSSSTVVPKKLAFHPIVGQTVSVIVTGDDPHLKRGKPAPDIFLLAAERLGVPSDELHECTVFEDSPFGVAGGISAGMQTVALPDMRFLTNKDGFREASMIFNSLDEFLTHPHMSEATV